MTGRSVGGVRRQRRPTEWLGFATALQSNTVTANDFFEILSPAQLAEYVNPTVVRLRGSFGLWGAGAILADATAMIPKVTIGFAIVTAQANTAAAIPVPAVDLDADWFLWDTYYFTGLGSSTGLGLFNEKVLDSKAMRRIIQPDNSALVMGVSTTMNGIAGEIQFRTQGRILIKGD